MKRLLVLPAKHKVRETSLVEMLVRGQISLQTLMGIFGLDLGKK